MATLAAIEQGLADLARLMRAQGAHGLVALPVFERLEREREKLLDIDDRLDRAIARGRSSKSPPRPIADRPNSHTSAA